MRWLKRIAIGVAVATALVGVGVAVSRFVTRQAGERRLREAEAALDRTDPGWRLADLLAARDAARPPDDRNLTKLCWEIHEARPAAFAEWEKGRGDWLPAERSRVPTPAAVAAARAAFATAADAVRLARTVRTRPTGGWPLEVPDDPLKTSLEHTQRVRTAAGLLQTDALLAALDGDGPRAAAAIRNGLHLGHAVGDEPCAISQLVRGAVAQTAADSLERTLGWGELPAGELAALAPLLLAEADAPRLLVGQRGDRAMYHLVCERVDAGRITLNQLVDTPDSWQTEWTAFQYRRFLPGDQADLLNEYTTVLDIARLPPHEWEPRLVALRPFRRDRQRQLLSGLLWPNAYVIARADARSIAVLRSAAAAAGCERFRLANGRWPAALADLGGPVPADPYTGGPLRLVTRADGLTVYATGPDRADDGGNLSYDSRPEKGQDVGFRLWDGAARRQPPPPPPPTPAEVWVPLVADAIGVAVWPPVGTVVATLLAEIARTVSEDLR